MSKAKTLLLFTFLFSIAIAKSQTTWCYSGTIIDADNSEAIAAAYISTPDFKNGCSTNQNGYFELCNLLTDSTELLISHTAFQQKKIIVYKKKAHNKLIALSVKEYSTEEIVVKADRNSLVKSFIPGKMTLNTSDIFATPTLLGTPDVIKSLQLLPGIQSVNEGNSGIYVRGGSPGQNYVLFDDIELMNPSHIMGIFSVFNPLLTKQVDFYKGNAPVHQSDRLASSIIVNCIEQKTDNYNWAGNIGNISTNISYNGKSKNNKWFFSSGIRRSYIELLMLGAKTIVKSDDNYFTSNNYYFYDFNGNIVYNYGKNKVKLSWYYGDDAFTMNQAAKNINVVSNWGNAGAALTWTHQLSSSSNLKMALDYTSYRSHFGTQFEGSDMYFKTQLQKASYKVDYSSQINKHFIRLGSIVTTGAYIPQDINIAQENNPYAQKDAYNNLSTQFYASDAITLSERWQVYVGLRMEHYGIINNKSLSEQSTHLNSVSTISYLPNNNSSIKASHAYTAQNIHLASLASIPLPSDIWMPATEKLPHEMGHQVTLGYFKELKQANYEIGIEAYGKSINNQLLLNPNFENNDDISFEDNFFIGKGLGYGVELLCKKNIGKTRGTLSYTLGWMQQQFDEINEGTWFNAKYDRRHDLNVVVTHKPNQKIDFGMVFMFATGNTATLPTGRYFMMGNIANDYAGVNNFRMPSYHRLDLSFNYHIKSKLFHESVLNFSIINIYNQSNPYFIYFQINEGDDEYDLSIKAKQSSFFPIIPSISWRFKF